VAFWLVDVSLLSVEFPITAAEKAFFANNSVGQFLQWPTFGTLLDSSIVPAALRKEMAIYWENFTLDDIPKRIPELRALLEAQYSLPAVIMIHCEAGMDRTGEMSGSYYMTYMDMSFTNALLLDDSINVDEDRGIMCVSQYAFQWYCLHQLYTGQYNLDNCTIPANAKPCSWIN